MEIYASSNKNTPKTLWVENKNPSSKGIYRPDGTLVQALGPKKMFYSKMTIRFSEVRELQQGRVFVLQDGNRVFRSQPTSSREGRRIFRCYLCAGGQRQWRCASAAHSH